MWNLKDDFFIKKITFVCHIQLNAINLINRSRQAIKRNPIKKKYESPDMPSITTQFLKTKLSTEKF